MLAAGAEACGVQEGGTGLPYLGLALPDRTDGPWRFLLDEAPSLILSLTITTTAQLCTPPA